MGIYKNAPRFEHCKEAWGASDEKNWINKFKELRRNDDYFLKSFFFRSFTFLPTSSLTMDSTDCSDFVSFLGVAELLLLAGAELLRLVVVALLRLAEAEPDLNPGILPFT